MTDDLPKLPDAVLLVSFGGPRRAEDVMPFLRRVTRGRGVPDERLAVVAQHYDHHGGRTPINEQHEALAACMKAEFARRGQPELPVYLGNRNWDPFLADALRDIVRDGHRAVHVVVMSAYSSYSGCRQYRENLAEAMEDSGAREAGVQLTMGRLMWDTPGFLAANSDAVQRARASLSGRRVALACVAHSIPTSMADTAGPAGGAYARQLSRVAEHVNAAVADAFSRVDVVYCSRSGPPHMPWTTPDVCDHIKDIASSVDGVVVAPIGFLSDHMEVIHDLDVEAAEAAAAAKVPFARADTALTHPAFVADIVDNVLRGATRRCSTGELDGPCCPNARAPHTPAETNDGLENSYDDVTA